MRLLLICAVTIQRSQKEGNISIMRGGEGEHPLLEIGTMIP